MSSWRLWAFVEACLRTAQAVFMKIVGVAIHDAASAHVYSGGIGIVNIFFGLFGRRDRPLYAGRKNTILSLTVGVFSHLANMLGPIAFMLGAPLAARTFIAAMSVIPGMFLGRFVRGERLSWLQLWSIPIFVFGAWAILGGPDIVTLILAPPAWVLLTLLVACTNAGNETMRSAMSKDYSPMVNNFWVGLVTVTLSGAGAIVFWGFGLLDFGQISSVLLWMTVASGVVVSVMTAASLMAYKGDALIALKKVFVNSFYLVSAAIADSIIFGVKMTALKWLGILCFMVAVTMTDKTALVFLFRRKVRRA